MTTQASRGRPVSLVIGSGGLLGKALTKHIDSSRTPIVLPERIHWGDHSKALTTLVAASTETVRLASGKEWNIFWCAGAGTTGTTQETFNREIALLEKYIHTLTGILSPTELSNGAFFYASSAGAIYAGSSGQPFTEHTKPHSLSPYGDTKIECERIVKSLTDSAVTVAIGRISNLYGPGQDLRKAQGLVSKLCLSYHTGDITEMFVSLDTLRDYIYVDDAASLVFDFLTLARETYPGQSTTKIIASGHSMSIAEILGTAKTILKRPLPLVRITSRQTKQQARDLRFNSVVLPELNARYFRSFPSGFLATNNDIGMRFRKANLTN